MRRHLISLASAALMAAAIALPAAGVTAAQGNQCDGRNGDFRGPELYVVGLTKDQRLICFEGAMPFGARTIGSVSGLVADTRIVGIDFRPVNGRLYGLGDEGGIYTLDLRTAAATLRSRLDVPLDGSHFGVDFNPTVDRLRVVDAGQNLRANVVDGVTLNDAALNHVGPPAVTPATGITAVGYTNNDTDANTATTLYDIDTLNDQLAIQAPPNAGILNTTGKLRVDASMNASLDVYSAIRNGTTVSVSALAALRVGGASRLYSVRLFSGQVRFEGNFKARDNVIGLAIPLNQL